MTRQGDWIQTYTGKKFWPLDPRPEEVCIEDIAHSLALLCRFGGHVYKHYSVAQHSVLVSEHCDPKDALWGLLHDAGEAYLADVTRPVKHGWRRLCATGLSPYDLWEDGLMRAVCERFGLPSECPASVKRADTLLLVTEARDLMGPLVDGWGHRPERGFDILKDRIVPSIPEWAEARFLTRFQELTHPVGTAA